MRTRNSVWHLLSHPPLVTVRIEMACSVRNKYFYTFLHRLLQAASTSTCRDDFTSYQWDMFIIYLHNCSAKMASWAFVSSKLTNFISTGADPQRRLVCELSCRGLTCGDLEITSRSRLQMPSGRLDTCFFGGHRRGHGRVDPNMRTQCWQSHRRCAKLRGRGCDPADHLTWTTEPTHVHMCFPKTKTRNLLS